MQRNNCCLVGCHRLKIMITWIMTKLHHVPTAPIYTRDAFESWVGKGRNGREVRSSFMYSRSKLIIVPFKIKNLVSAGHALAIEKGCQVSMSHLEVAIAACEDSNAILRA
jgi:hypothetical protein